MLVYIFLLNLVDMSFANPIMSELFHMAGLGHPGLINDPLVCLVLLVVMTFYY